MEVISGIYVIECVSTGERYIGSSIDIPRRWSVHRSQLRRQIHHSKLLQERWNQFGEAGLRFEILEIIPSSHLIAVERGYLKSGLFICNSTYPMRNPMKGRKHSAESIALMRANRKGIPGPIKKGDKLPKEFGERISRAKKGKKIKQRVYSPEYRAILRARMIALGSGHNKGKRLSEQGRLNIREAAARRDNSRMLGGPSHPSFGKPAWNKGIPASKRGDASAAKRIEIDGVVYPSLIDAAAALGVCVSTLHKRRSRGAICIKII